MTSTDLDEILVFNAVRADGCYGLGISIAAAHTVELDGPAAVAYADYWFEIIQRADYESAIYRADRAAGMSARDAASRLLAFVQTRTELDERAIAPLTLETHLGEDGTPALELRIPGRYHGRMSLTQASDHASRIRTRGGVIGLHNIYHRYLTRSEQLSDEQASARVLALFREPQSP